MFDIINLNDDRFLRRKNVAQANWFEKHVLFVQWWLSEWERAVNESPTSRNFE